MNTGLQDAYNLGLEALAGAARARPMRACSTPTTPSACRSRERLLATTDRAFRWSCPTADAGLLRTQVLARIAASRCARAPCADSRSARSPRPASLPRRPAGAGSPACPPDAPRAGDRFPWLKLEIRARPERPEDLFKRMDDRRFNLIVIGQPAPAAESVGSWAICFCVSTQLRST